MPSETVYFKEEQYSFLEDMVESEPGVNNLSQAVQYCVNHTDQIEVLEE